MRHQDTKLFDKIRSTLEHDKVFLDPHLSLSKLSVIVGTAITQKNSRTNL